MTLDSALYYLQNTNYVIGPPWGSVISNIAGTTRANMGRIQADTPAVLTFANDVIPVVMKHMPHLQAFWADLQPVLQKDSKAALASINDLLPIINKIVQEAQGK